MIMTDWDPYYYVFPVHLKILKYSWSEDFKLSFYKLPFFFFGHLWLYFWNSEGSVMELILDCLRQCIILVDKLSYLNKLFESFIIIPHRDKFNLCLIFNPIINYVALKINLAVFSNFFLWYLLQACDRLVNLFEKRFWHVVRFQ